jgi:hypothetical protein
MPCLMVVVMSLGLTSACQILVLGTFVGRFLESQVRFGVVLKRTATKFSNLTILLFQQSIGLERLDLRLHV